MSLHLLVIDPSGERRFDADQLPLRLGSSANADVRIPGPSANDGLLQIDQLDGVWFAQALTASSEITLNDASLAGSNRLGDGAVLRVFGTRIDCAERGDALELRIDWGSSSYRTAPPIEPTAGDEDADQEIVAATFRRHAQAATTTARRRPSWPLFVGGAIALLATLAGILFTSQSVRFETLPAEPGDVVINGGWLRLPVGERYLLRPGNYTVTLKTPGYYDAQRAFELGRDEPLTLRIEQRPRPGDLELYSAPPEGASVALDGEPLGKTPLHIAGLAQGRHELRVVAERYLPWDGAIDVIGLGRTQAVTVELVPAFGRVTVASDPPGAGIFSGSERLGETPGTVEVAEGRQVINVMLDGYKPEDIGVAVMANASLELEPVVLEKADGVLTVRTRPAGANITVNGRYRGQSPAKLALAPGEEYLIGLSKAGYGRSSRTVRMKAAEGQVLDVDLAARAEKISLIVKPDDAEVRVNGRVRGTGSIEFSLPASPQRIEVRREGYEPWRRTITPRPGFPQRVNVTLRTLDQARVSTIEQTLTTSQGPVLRYVDPGNFQIGASRRERGRRANETLRNIQLTKAYYIGTREITNREFLMFKKDHDPGTEEINALAGDKNPVVNVSWEDAVKYCNWLSGKDGLEPAYEERFGTMAPIKPTPGGYRLPTEAEWVWAARYQGGIGELKFPWGAKWPPQKESGNFADQSAKALVPTVIHDYEDGFAATAPVASFKGNALGLYDFGGNAAEWVQDYYEVYTPDASRVWIDPVGPEKTRHNVIRGSGWRHAGVTELRYSFRNFGSKPRPDVGFRIARSAP